MLKQGADAGRPSRPAIELEWLSASSGRTDWFARSPSAAWPRSTSRRRKGIAGFEKYVALKMIHPNFAEDEQFIQMLVDEAKIAVQLNHGNIAQTFDLGRVGETYYITMEYVDGADLYKILRRGSEHDIEMPLDVCAFVAQGDRERARSRAPQAGPRRQAARHRPSRRVAAERARSATRAR